ncbi:hypothetical protein I547_3545 [Mycobacterium kansasii 824]|nr:hypothetical protein I547_3545 [Mycobacterium kansasii 824]
MTRTNSRARLRSGASRAAAGWPKGRFSQPSPATNRIPVQSWLLIVPEANHAARAGILAR